MPQGSSAVRHTNGLYLYLFKYSSHYLGRWCIQHYNRWCAHLGCQQSTELTPPPI